MIIRSMPMSLLHIQKYGSDENYWRVLQNSIVPCDTWLYPLSAGAAGNGRKTGNPLAPGFPDRVLEELDFVLEHMKFLGYFRHDRNRSHFIRSFLAEIQ